MFLKFGSDRGLSRVQDFARHFTEKQSDEKRTVEKSSRVLPFIPLGFFCTLFEFQGSLSPFLIEVQFSNRDATFAGDRIE
jgi:hypothetical protein